MEMFVKEINVCIHEESTLILFKWHFDKLLPKHELWKSLFILFWQYDYRLETSNLCKDPTKYGYTKSGKNIQVTKWKLNISIKGFLQIGENHKDFVYESGL